MKVSGRCFIWSHVASHERLFLNEIVRITEKWMTQNLHQQSFTAPVKSNDRDYKVQNHGMEKCLVYF